MSLWARRQIGLGSRSSGLSPSLAKVNGGLVRTQYLRVCVVALVTLAFQIFWVPAWAAVAPATPNITEPGANGQVVSGADVHMETAPFLDLDGDHHRCTDWEIWTAGLTERVWSALCVTDTQLRVHIHLGDGVFEGSHAGRTSLLPARDYDLRVRHRSDSGDPATEWSAYALRRFP